ncbi:MAG: EAL domain-containing protein [Alphaproteobacteria bacterium]|nr:EAL domain-containing protein [Alphaproteobacteria bacterium]
MFFSTRKSLPAIDYVSIVRSLYDDKRTMILGALATVVATSAGAYKTGSLALWALAAGFLLVGIARWLDMSVFERSNLAADDDEGASRWEMRSTIGACATAALYGSWCFVALYFVNDPFAELSALSVTIATLVGVAARNYGVDRLVALQSILFGVPLTLALVLEGDVYYIILAALFAPFFISLRKIAGTIRQFLLSALHGRIEATRLAEELDTALDTMQHGLCMLDREGRLAVVNNPARVLFARFNDIDWKGVPFTQALLAAAEAGYLPKLATRHLIEGIHKGQSRKAVMEVGRNFHFEVTLSSRHGRTVLLFEDITERVKTQNRIKYMARYDSLTGLPNRTYFKEQVDAGLAARAKRRGPAEACMLMIVDLDDFKHVNDTHGHQAGDELLTIAAQRLRRALGKKINVARLGGDEFVVFCRDSPARLDASELGARIQSAFAKPFELSDQKVRTGVSGGAVMSFDAADEFETLLTKADLALYKAKGEGKGRIVVFAEEMDTEYRYRQRLKTDLRAAVENEQLYLMYQPIIARKSRRVDGCEALARWSHPEFGNIPPGVFIPIAEEIGVISQLSAWVLKTATRECMNWAPDMYISVNISPSDFRNGDVRAMVADALEASGLDANRLEIEVTEHVFLEEKQAAVVVLEDLVSQGIGIALDDFGTGYSSLSYLQDLPFTKLKIDRSFVVDVTKSERSLKLLTNIARLSKDLELTVTVEGVETEEQLALITGHVPVDFIQGFLFGAPLPRREVAELIRRLSAKSVKPEPVSRTG